MTGAGIVASDLAARGDVWGHAVDMGASLLDVTSAFSPSATALSGVKTASTGVRVPRAQQYLAVRVQLLMSMQN